MVKNSNIPPLIDNDEVINNSKHRAKVSNVHFASKSTIIKYFLVQKSCKFGEKCLYKHIDSTNPSDISDLKEKIVVLQDSVHVLTPGSDDLKTSQNELKIEMLEDKVKDLRSQIKKLKKITEKLYESVRDIPEVKQCEKKNVKDISDVEACEKEEVTQNITEKVKFNCKECNSSFKKKITLEKYMNMRHSEEKKPSKRKGNRGTSN